jgi:hypothetical protein
MGGVDGPSPNARGIKSVNEKWGCFLSLSLRYSLSPSEDQVHETERPRDHGRSLFSCTAIPTLIAHLHHGYGQLAT